MCIKQTKITNKCNYDCQQKTINFKVTETVTIVTFKANVRYILLNDR